MNVATSHVSIGASMRDYGDPDDLDFSPTLPSHSEYDSHLHESSPESTHRSWSRPSSPPAWRKAGSGWFKNAPALVNDMRRSPEVKQEDEDEDDMYTRAARIPLPDTPLDGRSPSPSPEPNTKASPATTLGRVNPFRSTPPALTPGPEDRDQSVELEPAPSNYFRFSTSLDILHTTDSIENSIRWLQSMFEYATFSRRRVFMTASIGVFLSWLLAVLFAAPQPISAPDLANVAAMAEKFQPAIYYSEVGSVQIEELHDTGMAVWDLGESVRASNMSGSEGIFSQLNELANGMNQLSEDLMHFFASIDGDVDNIIQVMEWVHRELETIAAEPVGRLSSMYANVQTIATENGIPGAATVMTAIIGKSKAEKSRATLGRVFNEMLNTLERAVSDELKKTLKLTAAMEAIDEQFLNLRRTTAREEDVQDQLESDFLGSLWTKALGPNASRLRKFHQNKALLESIRSRTVRNKNTLHEHKNRLRYLKTSLELLRRSLISPAISYNSTRSIEDQIQGLDRVYHNLKDTRQRQKDNVNRAMMGSRPEIGDGRRLAAA